MIFLNDELLTDVFGGRYKLHRFSDDPAPSGLEAEHFTDCDDAEHFLRRLDTRPGFWRRFISSCDELSRPAMMSDRGILRHVGQLLADGRIRFYRISEPDPERSPPARRRVPGANGVRYRFESASALLTGRIGEAMSVRSRGEAEQFIESLNIDDEHLTQIAADLEVPATGTHNPAGTRRALADALHREQIVVDVERPQSAPPKSQNEETLPTQGPGNMPFTLGPQVATAALTPAAEAAEPVCSLSQFTLQCGHGERGYILDVINDGPTIDGAKVLQVVTDPAEPDTVAVRFAGECVNGEQHCPAVEVSGGQSPTLTESDEISIELGSANDGPTSFTDFLKRLLAPQLTNLRPQRYTLANRGCAEVDKHEAIVQAFPVFQWAGDVAFGYQYPDGSKKKDKNSLEKQGEWVLEAGLEGRIGDSEWAFNTGPIEDFFPAFKGLVSDFVDKVESMSRATLDDINRAPARKDLVEFDMTWPYIQLGGELELQEIQGSHAVDLAGDVHLNMAPLIKANVSTDVISWLILYAGPHGQLLKEIRAQAEQGVGNRYASARAAIRANLFIEGAVDTALKWTKAAGQAWAGEGNASVAVTVGLQAEAEMRTEVLAVYITAGVAVHVMGARTSDEGLGIIVDIQASTAKGQPAVGGQITFTGVAVYYSYYAEAGVNEKDSNEKRQRRASGSDDSDFNAAGARASNPKVKTRKEKDKVVLIRDAQWPKQNTGATDIQPIEDVEI